MNEIEEAAEKAKNCGLLPEKSKALYENKPDGRASRKAVQKNMNYTLDSYGNFEAEQQILATASRKKAELEKLSELKENEILYRFKTINAYFMRLSWIHKKEYVLSILKNITCFDTLLKIISYISTLYGKMAAYTDVSPHVRRISQQILLDHDRTMEESCLKETACQDLNWIATLDKSKQMDIVMGLLAIGGGGLMRKLYIPLVALYNRKVIEDEKMRQETGDQNRVLDDVFNDKHLDDSQKYAQDHPLSIEVEKLRRKWDEIIEKNRREVFGASKPNPKETVDKKEKSKKGSKEKSSKSEKTSTKTSKGSKTVGKAQTDSADWVQMLPVWIVKQILSYLDQKTLQNLKKVNHYWSSTCDSVLKERQARTFLDHAIEKMESNVDPEILKQCEEHVGFFETFHGLVKKPNSPREKRMKKLMNRGAILKDMVPKVKKSQQVQSSLLTTIPKDKDMCTPLDELTVFPRLIKDDMLLYKSYPCYLKDVNILIDVEEDLRRQRDTLSYSLSQQLSDTFSMDEAVLEDW